MTLEGSGLRYSYGDRVVLDGVDLAIAQGELCAVIGPNGAGKSTLLGLCAGLLELPDAAEGGGGTLTIEGARVTPSRYPRDKVGVVLQREAFVDGMTVGDYAALFAAIYGSPSEGPGGAAAILERAALTKHARQLVSRLSGGEAQRLVLAAALAHRPSLLLLDEPTAALDPASKLSIGEAIVAARENSAVLLCTHDLAEAERLATRVLFLVDGRVVMAGTVDELRARTQTTSLAAAFFALTARSVGPAGEAI